MIAIVKASKHRVEDTKKELEELSARTGAAITFMSNEQWRATKLALKLADESLKQTTNSNQ